MELSQDFIKGLQAIVSPNQLLTEPSDVWTYGYDNSRKHHAPDAVALPTEHSQIEAIVKLCYEHNIPITGRGRASGTTGGAIPIHGGLVLSLERFNKILDFDKANRTVTVQAGVLNETVQNLVGEHGFFWGPDPSSAAYCTVGGNLACNAAGPRSVKYGTTRENTLGLKAVIEEGKVLTTGVHTTKGVVGYDFTRLMIGSEGTLGIITEATLKLLPTPQSKRTLSAFYASIDAAVESIVKVMANPIVPCALEMMDDRSLDIIRNHQGVPLPAQARAMLILEIDGSESSLDDACQQVEQSLKHTQLLDLQTAKTPEKAKELWALRKALSPALRSLSPHKINEDIVVPISQMPQLFTKLQELSKRTNIPIVNFGHGGNGNIHVNLLADPLDEVQGPIAHAALNEVFDTVISLGGTLSGEHGVGIEKRDFVYKELSELELTLMRNIKKVFDPKSLFNPDKMFPLV